MQAVYLVSCQYLIPSSILNAMKDSKEWFQFNRHFFSQSHEYQFVVLLISLNVVWQKNSSSCSLTLYWNLICAECTSVQISISRWFCEKVAWSCGWVLLFYPKIFSRWLVNGLHFITFRQCWLTYNLQIIYVLSSQKGLHRLARGA